MTNGRTSKVRRLHARMAERVRVQEDTIASLRGQLSEAANDVDRLRGDLGDVLERLDRVERKQGEGKPAGWSTHRGGGWS